MSILCRRKTNKSKSQVLYNIKKWENATVTYWQKKTTIRLHNPTLFPSFVPLNKHHLKIIAFFFLFSPQIVEALGGNFLGRQISKNVEKERRSKGPEGWGRPPQELCLQKEQENKFTFFFFFFLKTTLCHFLPKDSWSSSLFPSIHPSPVMPGFGGLESIWFNIGASEVRQVSCPDHQMPINLFDDAGTRINNQLSFSKITLQVTQCCSK